MSIYMKGGYVLYTHIYTYTALTHIIDTVDKQTIRLHTHPHSINQTQHATELSLSYQMQIRKQVQIQKGKMPMQVICMQMS